VGVKVDSGPFSQPATLPGLMKRIVILLSGRGSNMRSIVESCAEQAGLAQVVAVVSNRADAGGLAWAAERGIATAVVEHRQFPDRPAFDAELARVVDGFQPDLVLLAGFMRILTADFVLRYQGRLLNIHPSLLPAFSGLHTHQRAIDQGCKLAGATVHFVTPELDHGPIVAQAVVPVLPDDDEHRLAARVLTQEHRLYPLVVRWFVTGRLVLEGGVVRQLDGESQLLM
jgi:phosphoribosylglycinamide formyltransferase-1